MVVEDSGGEGGGVVDDGSGVGVFCVDAAEEDSGGAVGGESLLTTVVAADV